MLKFTASEEDQGTRADSFITRKVAQLSRSSIQKLFDQGKIRINGELEKTKYNLHGGDKITIDYNPAELEQIPDIDLPVIYEDDDCVVISKPVCLLTHSKGAFNPEATVATWLKQRLESRGQSLDKIFPSSKLKTLNSDRSGIVHRLDRATSGVMICAKTPEALAWLQKQFSQRRVKKTYVAIVSGQLEPEAAVIDMPIERNPKKPQTFRVGPNGKPAITAYKTLEKNADHTMVELKPETGRTHQLRVHLKQLKHPIVGDTLYGGELSERLMLHALSLELTLSNRQRQTFTIPLPKEFNQFMKK